MYSRPSSSTRRAPRPSRKNTGVPPTARNARTGELTPPGISRWDRSNSSLLRSYMGIRGCEAVEKARERGRCAAHVGVIEKRRDHREHLRTGGKRKPGVASG